MGGKGGTEEVWDPKLCAPEMARAEVPHRRCCCFPRWSLWSGGGGGGGRHKASVFGCLFGGASRHFSGGGGGLGINDSKDAPGVDPT